MYRYGADDVLREVRATDRRGTRVTRFGYDALGRRVWKAAARLSTAAVLAATGATADAQPAAPEPPDEAWQRTGFVWSGDVLVAESERPGEDALATVYVYEPGSFRPLAVAKRDGGGNNDSATIYRYHVDHLGTPQGLTDAAGAVAWRAEYRAWGALAREAAREVAQPLRFPGQYADAETGLHYNRHRYYAPNEGRFVSQDPIRLFGGTNLGAYTRNPVSWTDPFGLAPCALGDDTSIYRAMKQDAQGNWLPGAPEGAPNANTMGARTPASTSANKNPTIDITPVGPDQMVGPNYTGQSGLSASLDPLPTRPGQLLGKTAVGDLPEGLGAVNDHARHVSIYPSQDMTFPEF